MALIAPESSSYRPEAMHIEAGIYHAQVVNAESKRGREGEDQIELTYQLTGTRGKPIELRRWLTLDQDHIWSIFRFWASCGRTFAKGEPLPENPEEYRGRRVMIATMLVQNDQYTNLRVMKELVPAELQDREYIPEGGRPYTEDELDEFGLNLDGFSKRTSRQRGQFGGQQQQQQGNRQAGSYGRGMMGQRSNQVQQGGSTMEDDDIPF